MKLTKKLFPAIGMLLLSACMLVTSTFAWFSMNTDVSATNMQVTAKGDQVYLQIVSATTNFEDGKAQTKVENATNDTKYIPTNVYASMEGNTPSGFVGSSTFVWVKATSNDPAYSDNAPNAEGEKSPVKYEAIDAETVPGAYAYLTSYKLRLDPKAGQTDGDKLRVTSVAFATVPNADEDPLSTCVSVLIVVRGEATALLYKQLTPGVFTSCKVQENTLVDAQNNVLTAGDFVKNTEKIVDVYVFFDGDNANCTTKNVTTSTKYAISVSFTVAQP